MATVGAYADALIESHRRLTDEERHEYLCAIKRSIEHINRLLSNVLDAALSESKGLPLALAPVQLSEVILALLRSKGFDFRERVVDTCLDPGLPAVYADKARIELVLKNLLANAVKFSPSGGLIHVSARSFGDGIQLGLGEPALCVGPNATSAPCIVISVRDSGVGIPPKEQEGLFTKFCRSGQNASGAPGLGLGLYVCRKIVEAHGGSIWVKSEPQRGSEFSFSLPIAHP